MPLCSQVSNNPIFSPLEQFTVSTLLPIQIASLDLVLQIVPFIVLLLSPVFTLFGHYYF
jgi:hypothetical protein